MTNSTPLVPSLLRILVHADGDALVVHMGDRPHVVASGVRVDLGTRDLPVDVIHQLVEQLLPTAAHTALDELGVVAYVLPQLPTFPGEHFTVVVTGGDDLRVVIQRRRGETEPRVGVPASQERPKWADVTDPRDGADVARRTARCPPVVLLIEDSLDQLDLYEVVLRDVFQLRLASSGKIGVKLAIEDPPDIALVDLEMPDMGGWEVCRRLRAHPLTATVPLVILTARALDGLGHEAMRVGVADLLSKPCSVDTLRKRIRAVLDMNACFES